jgi:DNA-binding CsgD family transcriptional regulator
MIDMLNTFVETAFASITPTQVAEHFAHLAAQLGFSATLVIDTAKLEATLPPAIVFATAPAEVVSFERRIPFLTNPIVHHAAAVDTPFGFADVCSGRGLRESELRLWLPDPAFDVHVTWFPVHRGGRLVFYIACWGDKPDDTRIGRAVLHTCAHATYDRSNALSRATLLSQREADCLYWIAQGKTYSETGDILQLASRTVRAIMAAAKQKLGARTKSEAIAKAIAFATSARQGETSVQP